jgi:type IV secretion system protein VirB2
MLTSYCTPLFRSLRQYLPSLFMLAIVAMMVAMPDLAHAAADPGDGTGQGALPFEGPLAKLTKSLSGPVAFGISLVGIIAAGAVLIFGGEMSGFLRTLVFLVLVIAVIVNAKGLIGIMAGDGATIASYVEGQARAALGALRSMA